MSVVASQMTSLTIVYSTVYLGVDQRKHQSSALLAFVREIHRWHHHHAYMHLLYSQLKSPASHDPKSDNLAPIILEVIFIAWSSYCVAQRRIDVLEIFTSNV